MNKCQWCLGMKEDCKRIQIIKWKNEATKGIRSVCKNCRKYLKGEFTHQN